MGNQLYYLNYLHNLEENTVISHSRRPEYFINPEQVRGIKHHKVHLEKAFKYAKDMENGDKFPPVQIFFCQEQQQWCCKDGAHRTTAAKMTGLPLYVRSKQVMGGEINEN